MGRLSHLWHHSTWLSSETRHSMTAAQRGVYRDALDLCYAEGSIPADEPTLMRLLAITLEEFAETWPTVRDKFEAHPEKTNRLINRKAAEVLGEQERYSQKQSANAHKRWDSKRKATAEASQCDGINLAMPKRSSKEDLAHHSMSKWGEFFEQWWALYPRKIAKTDAQKAYQQLVVEGKVKPDQRADLNHFPNFADRHAELVTATKRWARMEFGRREADKIPYPATYLRRLDWLSAPELSRHTPPPIQMSWESDETYQARIAGGVN